MRHNKSSEDYMETILILSRKLPVVRSIDIAVELNFSKPSVSVAMKHLRENGCIVVSQAGFITLTDKGMEIATSVYERHQVLSNWLISLGVDPKTATEDACEMEHQISDESFQAMKKFIEEHTITSDNRVGGISLD
ncbi:metal-dependent transcriptional regulator [[Clostridium] scindens]|uniref:metal-dependent transcriptional regulator n=1 Tax=Clostridium scindens (strain JCM 10418 / VPI 12708) TaxID=29347 RepID=UPI00242F18E4|nr:metal-dependent transcriptional regulator [[Clostridium] scindens]